MAFQVVWCIWKCISGLSLANILGSEEAAVHVFGTTGPGIRKQNRRWGAVCWSSLPSLSPTLQGPPGFPPGDSRLLSPPSLFQNIVSKACGLKRRMTRSLLFPLYFPFTSISSELSREQISSVLESLQWLSFICMRKPKPPICITKSKLPIPVPTTCHLFALGPSNRVFI